MVDSIKSLNNRINIQVKNENKVAVNPKNSNSVATTNSHNADKVEVGGSVGSIAALELARERCVVKSQQDSLIVDLSK